MPNITRFAQRFDASPDELRRWLIEAMILGAGADGHFHRRESEEIISVVSSHAAFAGMDSESLQNALTRSVEALRADGFVPRVHALAGALPRYAHRVLAFRAATRVAFADGKLSEGELGLLRELQEVLGIVETDVARAIEDAQSPNASPLPSSVEPIEAYLDVMLMASAMDGVMQDEELATIIAFIMQRPEFDNLDGDILRDYIDRNAHHYRSDQAVGQRLRSLPDDLPLAEHRENAWSLAVQVVVADGSITEDERQFLHALRLTLDLDEARAELAGIPSLED